MSKVEPSDVRVRRVLEAWFLAEDAGERPELSELCGGDAGLVRQVAALLGRGEAHAEVIAAALGAGRGDGDLPACLGEFEIVAPLASGGMGRVFVARQVSLGRHVALKVLAGAGGLHAGARRRFTREARLAAALDHPNIVPVYASGEAGGVGYIAMKWLTGPALDELAGRLEPGEVARIGCAVAAALEEAHTLGVVHRDVKPSNVILDDGNPCLVDFGLARTDGDGTLTREGVVPGTLAYLPPERLRAPHAALDPRADLYALGATLYEAVAGHPPFAVENREQLLRDVLLRDPPPLGLTGRDADLETIIMRAMEKEPARRFQTARSLGHDLDRYRRGEPIASRPLRSWHRAWRLVRRHRRAAAALFGLGVLLAAAVGWSIARARRDARLLDERTSAVRTAIDARRFTTAATLLQTLRREAPGSAELARLARHLDGALALEALLDQVQDRSGAQNAARLRQLTDRLRASVAPIRSRRLARLALALAALFRHDGERALRLLDEVERSAGPEGGRGRDTIALRAAATGAESDLELDLGAQPARAPERHVIAALALRALGAPAERQRHEIEAALELDPTHFRALYALAILHAEQREHAAALAAFTCLRRPDRPHPAITRNLARLRLWRGDLEGAARAMQRIAPADRGPPEVLLSSELLRRRGDRAAARAALDDALSRWGDDPDVRFQAAAWAAEAGDAEEALDHFDHVIATSLRRPLVEQAQASRLFVEYEAWRRGRTAGADGHAAWAKRAARLAQAAASPEARAVALVTEASAHLALDRLAPALTALRAAVAANPEHGGARVVFLRAVRSVVVYDDLPRPRDVEGLCREAREHARALIDGEGRGLYPPRRKEVTMAMVAAAEISLLLRDAPSCRAAGTRALERMSGDEREQERAYVRELLRRADEL